MVKQLSANPNNTVIGLVRDKAAVQKKVAAEIGDRPNIHILHGDLDDQSSLEQSAAETAKIVGDRGLDYLVANAAYLPLMDGFDHISKLYVFFPLAFVCCSLWLTLTVQQ
jgi:NAD(P)-dependent dehydrogenase (short-subunit alcohol dehydrogenase family)